MSTWEMILFAVAAYISLFTLIKMMRKRQRDLTKQFRKEFDREQQVIAQKITEQKLREREQLQAEKFEEMMAKRSDAA